MIKNNLILFFLPAIILSILAIQCETIMDLELPEVESRLVIECAFTPDSIFSMRISSSSGLNNKEDIKWINNASVRIFENGVFKEELPYLSRGVYKSLSFRPSERNEYVFTASSPEYESVSAKNILPAGIEIDSVESENLPEDLFQKYRLKISFKDPAEEKNYYYLTLISGKKTGNLSDYEPLPFETSDPSIKIEDDQSSMEGHASFEDALFKDDLFNGKNHQLIITLYRYFLPDSADIRLCSISKELFEYLKTLKKQNNDDDLSLTEPVRIYTNIDNGFGIFGGYTLAKYTVKLKTD